MATSLRSMWSSTARASTAASKRMREAMMRASLGAEKAKAQLLDVSAPIRKSMFSNMRDMVSSSATADPDMALWARSWTRVVWAQIWADIEDEIERTLEAKLLKQLQRDDLNGPQGTPATRWYLEIRRFVLHRYLPHNRSIFGKMRDPVFLLFLFTTLLPIHCVRVAFLALILIFLLVPGPPDEYQLVSFILGFKGTQFLSSGIFTLAIGAAQYFRCYSFEKLRLLECIDGSGPGVRDVRGQLLDYFGSVFLVWVAHVALRWSKKYARPVYVARDAAAREAAKDKEDALNTLCGCMPGRHMEGGRLQQLLCVDFGCFLVSMCALLVLTACTSEADFGAPQFSSNVYWCKVLYSMCSLPFLIFLVPLLCKLLTHSDPTGFNEHGACVEFAIPVAAVSEPAAAAAAAAAAPARQGGAAREASSQALAKKAAERVHAVAHDVASSGRDALSRVRIPSPNARGGVAQVAERMQAAAQDVASSGREALARVRRPSPSSAGRDLASRAQGLAQDVASSGREALSRIRAPSPGAQGGAQFQSWDADSGGSGTFVQEVASPGLATEARKSDPSPPPPKEPPTATGISQLASRAQNLASDVAASGRGALARIRAPSPSTKAEESPPPPPPRSEAEAPRAAPAPAPPRASASAWASSRRPEDEEEGRHAGEGGGGSSAAAESRREEAAERRGAPPPPTEARRSAAAAAPGAAAEGLAAEEVASRGRSGEGAALAGVAEAAAKARSRVQDAASAAGREARSLAQDAASTGRETLGRVAALAPPIGRASASGGGSGGPDKAASGAEDGGHATAAPSGAAAKARSLVQDAKSAGREALQRVAGQMPSPRPAAADVPASSRGSSEAVAKARAFLQDAKSTGKESLERIAGRASLPSAIGGFRIGGRGTPRDDTSGNADIDQDHVAPGGSTASAATDTLSSGLRVTAAVRRSRDAAIDLHLTVGNFTKLSLVSWSLSAEKNPFGLAPADSRLPLPELKPNKTAELTVAMLPNQSLSGTAPQMPLRLLVDLKCSAGTLQVEVPYDLSAVLEATEPVSLSEFQRIWDSASRKPPARGHFAKQVTAPMVVERARQFFVYSVAHEERGDDDVMRFSLRTTNKLLILLEMVLHPSQACVDVAYLCQLPDLEPLFKSFITEIFALRW